MNKVLQRIAIAESQGWKHDICSIGEHGTMRSGWWMPCGALTTDINMLPDYLNDLNAMHEAEEVLTEEQRIAYTNHTYDIACKVQLETEKWRWISLTAAQRAEAFLKTLGLWEEGE